MTVHELPASKASIKQNQFQFKVPGDRKTWSIPLMQHIPIGWRERFAAAAEPIRTATMAGDQVKPEHLMELGEVQVELLNKYAPGVLDVLDSEQLAALLKAWEAASKISMGESSASH